MSGTAFAIPASQIVRVTPQVLPAGGTGLDLVGLMLTQNQRVPVGQVLTFPTQAAVQQYFGGTSLEALVANVYFKGYNNSFVKPGSIWFTQYNTAPVGAWSRGASVAGMTIAELQAIPPGDFHVTIDGVAHSDALIDLSTATSFSEAANLIATGLTLTGATSASFMGSIAGTTMTVTSLTSGAINLGDEVMGTSTTPGTTVVGFGTGTGGDGTYTVSTSQTVVSEAMTTVRPAVAFDPVAQSFVVSSATTGTTSTIAAPTGSIAQALSMDAASGAIVSQGAVAAAPASFMDGVIAYTENWASFTTLFDPDGGSGSANKLEFAQWVDGVDGTYLYVAWDTDPAPSEQPVASACLGQALKSSGYSGTAAFWSPTQGPQMAGFLMGAIASINFEQTNGRTTLKFRGQSGLKPDVISGLVSSNLQSNGYNFYGTWNTANDAFTFMSDGSLSGPFAWLDSYVNMIWLTNAFQLALMELLTTASSIPYNPMGYGMIRAACMDPIDKALNFGIFYTGVTLSEEQRALVNGIAGATVDYILTTQGYYLSVRDAPPDVRAVRGSPAINFFYMDGGSIQRIDLTSTLVQ
jgi:Protein of unknown function (DUF3383)